MTKHDYDADNHFMEQIHHVMGKCPNRKEMDGIGACHLYVLPCEKVLYDGNCEAVREWIQRGEEHEDN